MIINHIDPEIYSADFSSLYFCYSYMNISFSNAVYCDPQGNEYLFVNLFVQGRNIRYVHIPETVSILPLLDIILINWQLFTCCNIIDFF